MSGHFSSRIGLLDDINGEDYRVIHGFRYYLTADEGGAFVDVPDGFVTNFASTPRLLWALFPPTGSYRQIAVVHDKLFLAPVIRTATSARPCSFEEATDLFLDGSTVLGVSWLTRRVMYRTLQAFSRPAWDRYRQADRRAIASATAQQLVSLEAIAVAARTLHGEPIDR